VNGLKIISDTVEVSGKRVLVRIDGDVSIEKGVIEPGGEIRLFSCEDTVLNLVKRGAKVILMCHLGRPNGKIELSLSVVPVAKKLSEKFGFNIQVADSVVGTAVNFLVGKMEAGEVVMLENLRFDSREETDDEIFAKELAELGDVYIDESFANSHRKHASMHKITQFLPSYAGFHFAKEIMELEKVMSGFKRPIVAAISGAKIETKAALLENLLPQIDFLITGGGVANMFIQADGKKIGNSIAEPSMLEFVKGLLEKYRDKIFVPSDVRVLRSDPVTGKEEVISLESGTVTQNDAIYDIGPKTSAFYRTVIEKGGMCIWNGPMGKTELPDFTDGTKELAKAVIESKIFTVVGGGDTIIALNKMNLLGGINGHVSTGGGAMIALLQGEKLPAVEVLRS